MPELTAKEIAASEVKSTDTLKSAVNVSQARVMRVEYDPTTELTSVSLEHGYDPGSGFVRVYSSVEVFGKDEYQPDFTGLIASLKVRGILA